jgi:hypothetical protein
MRIWLITLALFCAEVTLAQTSTVTVRVIDKDGYAVEHCRVDSFVDRFMGRRNGDMTSHFSGLRGTEIPYGVYKYTLKRGLGGGQEGEQEGTISVTSREALIVVQAGTELQYGVSVDVRFPDSFVIRGKLDPMPRQNSEIDPIWIRLSPVHGDDQLDVSVDASGDFRIYHPLWGRYVLLVIQGNDVLHVQPITFERTVRSQNFTVKLLSKPLEVITVQ